MTTEKQCTKCGGIGPFYQGETSQSTRCKDCTKKTIYDHRKKTNYASNKKYLKTKSGKVIRQRIIYKYNNSKRGKEQQYANRILNIKNFLSHKLSIMKCKSRTKNKQINLDLKYLTDMYTNQNGKCKISNIQMTIKHNDLCSISIDRIDSSNGYIKGNIQLVCRAINLAKQHLPNQAIIDFVRKIYVNYSHKKDNPDE